MKRKFTCLLILVCFKLNFAQTKFSDFLSYVNSLPYNQKEAVIDSFMASASQSGIPIIEDTTVYFIYRGEAKYVFVAGDFNEWDGYLTYMIRVKDTDLQYLKREIPRDARTFYMIRERDSTWHKDPYNPKYVSNGGSLLFSILEMPEYVEPWETSFYEGTPQGSIESFNFYSTIMDANYETHVYLPPGYNENDSKEYPTAYFQDGNAFLNAANAQNVLDNIIDNNSIEPVIAVFVEPNDRSNEYAYSKRFDYANFFANELVPYIDGNYKTRKDPSKRLIAGVSYGGTISGYISYLYPETFTNCGLLSAIIYVNNSELYGWILNDDKKEIKYFAIWGTFEGVLPAYLRNFRKLTQEKGYEFNWAQYNEGHNFDFWKAHIDDLLINFYPLKKTTGVTENKILSSFSLQQNYPNPFNPITKISFTIPNSNKQQNAELIVYDLLGNKVASLLDGNITQGYHEIEFKAADLSSGIYFYRLTCGNFSKTQKMILIK